MKRSDVSTQDILGAWNDNLSLNAIARKYSCSVDMVKKRLLKSGVSDFSRSAGASKHYVSDADCKWDAILSDLYAGCDIKYLMCTYHMTKKRLQDLFDRHGFDYVSHMDNLLRDKLVVWLDDGKTVSEIADVLGKSVSTARRYLSKFGLTEHNNRDDVSDQDVLALWNAGLTMNEIAYDLACSHDTVEKRLLHLGITCDRASGVQRHFERSHEKLWDAIKCDLDQGVSLSVVHKKYHMASNSLERLLVKHDYKRPCGRVLDYCAWNKRMDFAKSPDGLCEQKSMRYVDTEIKYLNSIRQYAEQYGSLPTVRTLAEDMGYAFSSVNEIINSHQLSDFVDTSPSCGGVLRVMQLLQKLGVSYETNNRRILQHNGSGLEIDIWIPEFNFGIEVNPTGTHSVDSEFSSVRDVNYHQRKSLLAEQAGVGLVHLYDDDFLDDRKYQIFVNQLAYRKAGHICLGARKCELKPVSRKDSNLFLNHYHFQGSEQSSSVRYGLYFDDILVSLLCIGRSRYTSHDYEIIRYCVHPGYAVSGGFGRLFHAFLNTLEDSSTIVSYMDLNKRFSCDNVYHKNGFVAESVTQPDYVWAKKYGMPVLKRYQTTKSKLVADGYDPDKTEVEIMRERGFFRVFGAGSRRYVFTLDKK